MLKSSFKKSLMGVVLSRIVSLLSSVVVGLLLPKVLSVQDYGYLKIFSLYAVYTSLLHFGFVDGILLKIAGKDYSELNQEEMRSYSRFFVSFELVIALIMIVAGVICLWGEYAFIMFALALDMVLVNITTYYQLVSQATRRFSEYSQKSVLVSIAKLVFIGALFAVYLMSGDNVSYRTYLVGIVLLDFLMLIWYIWIYRDITFGFGRKIRSLKREIFGIFKIGIVLTIAYQTSHLVLALDRQFVSVLFSTEEYAVYSFAYNIVSMISTVISSISVVMLPMLKKAGKQYTIEHYKSSLIAVTVLIGISLFAYFPARMFIVWFLPEYKESVDYIAVVLPSILLSSGISIVMFTIDKVMETISAFFKSSVVALIMGFLTNLIAYLIFETRFSISCASILTMAVWYLIEGRHLKKITGYTICKEFIYIVLLTVGFLSVIFFVDTVGLGAFLYVALVLCLTAVFYGKQFYSFLRSYTHDR